MSDDNDVRGVQFSCFAERVLAADPARVWALVADPARVDEWGAAGVVGYMGTEMPRSGQVVFVRTRRWQPPSRARRVKIDVWDAGAGYRCTVQSGPLASFVGFELEVHPEVTGEGIATRIRLVQRTAVPGALVPLARRYVDWQLERRIDRIDRVVAA